MSKSKITNGTLRRSILTPTQTKIFEFWKIRGWDEIEHTMGTNLKLNRTKTKHYPSLNGIDMIYLEQFYDSARDGFIEIAEIISIMRKLLHYFHHLENLDSSSYQGYYQMLRDELTHFEKTRLEFD